jgi:hypothetical protein
MHTIAERGEATAVNTEMKEGTIQQLDTASARGARLFKPGFAIGEGHNAREASCYCKRRQHFRLMFRN